MNNEQREKIHKILDLCIDVKEKGHDCFLYYMPHVDKIDISCNLLGWRSKTDADYYNEILLKGKSADKKLDEVINYITNLLNKDGKDIQIDIFKNKFGTIMNCKDVNRRDLYLTELLTNIETAFSIPALNDEEFNAANQEVIELYRAVGDERSYIKKLKTS